MIGPSQAVVQSEEVEFSSSLTYPFTFAFVVTNREHGLAGQGHYTVDIFCQDMNAKVQKI